MKFTLPCCLAFVACALASSEGQQPRDSRSPVTTGTATIAGLVVDAEDSRPLRRARVTISAAELEHARTIITADDGTFTFEGLGPGGYLVSAAKDGHVRMNFGALRPDRPGKRVVLGRSADRARVTIALPRGSVITGTVLNAEGEPTPGVSVTVLVSQYDAVRGERRISPLPNATAVTDDRGIYRVFGLAAGTYFVSAAARSAILAARNGNLQVQSESDIRAALDEVGAARTATRPGIPEPPAPINPAVGPGKGVVLAPVFYPGTSVQTRAAPITLAAGEVRNGIDIDLEYVPTATIEGLVTVPPGVRVQLLLADADPSAANPSARISRAGRAGDDGRFSFRAIPPGSYTITARGVRMNVRSSLSLADADLWGETGVIVAGDDISGIAVPLQPALTISGRLEFVSSRIAAPQLTGMRLPLPGIYVSSGGSVPLPPVVVDGSTFSIAGIMPGTHRFSSTPRGIRTPIGPWWLKSMTIDGKELLDSELEVNASADTALITFSDQASELSGIVRYADDTPLADGFVVVFSTNDEHWFHNSRRVAGARPSANGRYAVRNLPPGDYHVAVTTDLAPNEWFDPEVLRALQPSAATVRIRDNEVKAYDLSVAK